jgi:predicted DNA-binding transcriptional regulator AlpA
MGESQKTLEPLLTDYDIARLTGRSVTCVRRWRLLRQGPKYIKIGAAVRYKPEDVSAWLESRPTGGNPQKDEAR